MEKEREYYIGLDGGTDSVGWAVVNPDYTVVKKHGKALWGARLFESGQSAADRRAARSSRRRTDRKKWRLKLLKEIFAEEVAACDPAFFIRLAESRYWEDDKKMDGADSLFHDADFTDRAYHQKFPTIYHLRQYLMNCGEKPDIRLFYLAAAHIIKNRGHFLNEGQTLEESRQFGDVWQNLCNAASETLGLELPRENEKEVAALLTGQLKVKEKTKQLEAFFGSGEDADEKAMLKAMAGLLAGGKTAVSSLFNDEALDECGKICLSEKSPEELEQELGDALGEDHFALLRCACAVYNWAVFARLLPEGKTISQVKVAEYEDYRQELHDLKAAVKKYAPEKYYRVFRSAAVKGNYASYTGKTNCGSEKTQPERCRQEEFYAFLKKELKTLWENDAPAVSALQEKLQNGTLLCRLRSGENSVIPYQAHLQELRLILKNMQRFYPFLQKADENGYTPAYKIEKLLTFRIPYYVGPLNDAHKDKGFCWVVKKADQAILPWNFETVVDETACENAFIQRMTSTCTYLLGEDVLPLNSPLYCRFMVLNEVNNLRICGEKIPSALKQKIFSELFCAGKGGKITRKKLLDYLHSQGIEADADEVSGIDGDFKASMTPALKLKNCVAEPVSEETLEELAFALTVSGDSQKMLKKRVQKILGPGASEAAVRKVCGLKFSGWGRLSRKLLTGIYDVDKATGECRSIMDLLWQTNQNLMQLLGGEYGFAESIRVYNAAQNGKEACFDYDYLVKELYISPSVKRGLWQMLLLVKEIRKIMGHDPARIFIEMARGASPEQKNRRTVSRKEQLLALYKACKDDTRDWCAEIDALPEDKLRSDKLYLYYTQMGRCMYSGDKINLDDLMHDSANQLYDIDHIYPQSKTKDDSLTNRVLVKRQLNAEKTNVYPVPQGMRQPALWKVLLDKQFISRGKYERLMRNTPFTEEELAGFINRQLVETRQSTKAAAHLLQQLLPQSEIVYVKAGLAADFRQEFDFVKCRDANDFHHAKDAYLNVVVGNVYHEKFTKDPLRFVRSGQKYSLNLRALFKEWNVSKNGRIIWQKGEEGSLKAVRARMAKNDPMITRYCYEGRGALYDLQPKKKGLGQLPLKSGDERLENIDRYGGYNKVAGAYFTLTAWCKKGKRVKSMEAVPLYRANEFKQNPKALQAYLAKQLEVESVEILIPEIKMGALFKWDGFPMTISGRTGVQLLFRNAAELHTTQEQEQYIKKMRSYLDKCKGHKEALPIRPAYDKLTKEENLSLYDAFTELLASGIYAKRLSAQGKFLAEKREKFAQLTPEEQVQQLAEILHLFQCNPVAANLSLLGGAAHAGILLVSKKIDEKTQISIINQSITGYFANEVCLNDL